MAQHGIGAGGWAYFLGPSGHHLIDYARAFSFVEVNATFYALPAPPTVRRWRRSVPRDFRFSMRAPSVLTHRLGLRPGPTLRRGARETTRIAHALNATELVLETPATASLGDREVGGLRVVHEVLTEGSPGTRLGLEARAYRNRSLPPSLRRAMEANEIIDVVDLSSSSPRVASNVVYSRLFGPGEGNRWEFTDEELQAIAARADDARAERAAFAFHGVRMYTDAARFLRFHREGTFPPVTKTVGLASLDTVLRDGGARLPATGEDLVRDHGWRVIRLAGGTEHASILLSRLGRRTKYRTIEDVVEAVGASPRPPEGGPQPVPMGRSVLK